MAGAHLVASWAVCILPAVVPASGRSEGMAWVMRDHLDHLACPGAAEDASLDPVDPEVLADAAVVAAAVDRVAAVQGTDEGGLAAVVVA